VTRSWLQSVSRAEPQLIGLATALQQPTYPEGLSSHSALIVPPLPTHPQHSAMSSVDNLFRKPNAQAPGKRKFESHPDSAQAYKSPKLAVNGSPHQPALQEENGLDDDEEGPQLPPDEEDEDYGPEEDEDGRFFGGGVDKNTKEALNYLDQTDQEPYVPEKFDIAWVRRTVLNFKKRISKNTELRAKFENDPSRFMSSEADLDEEVKALSILSEHPELYEEFTKLGCVGSLVSLLSHENTDIAIDALQILSELTDEDVEAEQHQWDAVANALLDAGALSLVSDNLDRLDEDIEADREGVYHALSLLENLASNQKVAEKIGAELPLMKWILSRIQKKENPLRQNTQYAAEVLSILLQSSRPNRMQVVSNDGIDSVLQLLAPYRKRDPTKDTEEEEYVENLFDLLICLVKEPEGKSKFLEAEGVELCLIMLREGKMSKERALAVLDHAAADPATENTSPDKANNSSGSSSLVTISTEVCRRIVEAGGLKSLFKLFAKPPNHEASEHILGIITAMFKTLPGNTDERVRLVFKFTEKDYDKVNILIKLRHQFSPRLNVLNQEIAKAKKGMSQRELEEMEEEWLTSRFDAGLISLQMIDTIIAWLTLEDEGVKKKVNALLSERGESMADVKRTLKEQLSEMDISESDDQSGIRAMLETLLGLLD
jgi:beta-catenin-like protein 1